MGNEIRRIELRIAKLEKAAAEQNGIIERLQQVIGAVAESAGSALAVEALTELAGVPAVEAKMREVARRKQTEAEEVMAGRVKAAVERGQLRLGEVVTAQSLIVGERREGEAVKYRVDLHPAPKAYIGKQAGDVVEEEGSKTEIREVYEVVKTAPEPAAAQEVAHGGVLDRVDPGDRGGVAGAGDVEALAAKEVAAPAAQEALA